jgi:flavin reductase (DIM6/NTAB) family NADH-FMN oxidoreductase RutF
MDIDFCELSPNHRYKLLTALVVPRPIAWVTSLNPNGSVNAAPYSFFNVLGNRPPLVAIGTGDRPDGTLKDTPRNIEERKEFVVNLADRPFAELLHQSSAPFVAGESEVDALGIPTEPSTTLKTPRIKGCKVHLECELAEMHFVEQNRIVFGFIRHLHVEDGVIEPETFHVQPGAFEGIGRLQGPGWYCTSADRFDLGKFPAPTR